MKKILYSLMAIGGLFATSCATFDDPVTENYGDGPKVTITVTESEISDSTFTFTVNAEGAAYYSVLVDQASEAETLDATSLYKGAYSSTFAKAAIDASTSYTYNMRDAKGAPLCKPNTTYVIYAVAGSKEGIVGEVATAVVTTTDALIPRPTSYQYDSDSRAMYVSFTESVTRGEGAVTAVYYNYLELTNGVVNPVEVAAENIRVAVSGSQIGIQAAGTPAGAFVAFSYEAGAFVDSKGNTCKAMPSGYSSEADDLIGLVGQNDNVNFEVTEENLVVTESSFGDWTEFTGEIAFDFNIYTHKNTPSLGALSVTYTNGTTSKTIKLPSSSWMVQGKSIYFLLPEACEVGDNVTVSIAEGVVMDVNGNYNDAYDFESSWLCSYGYERSLVLGTYSMTGVSYWDRDGDGSADVWGESFTITADPDSENGVLIDGMLYGLGATVKGVFDGDYGTITVVPDYNIYSQDGYTYSIEGYTNDSKFSFQISDDGTLTANDWWGYGVYDTSSGSWLGWNEMYVQSVATKGTATVDASAASVKIAKVKNVAKKSLKK